jgi:hypothetical protein
MLATSLQLGLATPSLLPRLSHHRKCILVCSCKSDADLRSYSEVPGVNKIVPSRNSAWPTQGGLQSIGNAAAFRGQIPALPARTSVIDVIPPRSFTAVAIKPDIAEINTKSKTPSPQKLTVKIEPAGGKENVNINVTSQTTC